MSRFQFVADHRDAFEVKWLCAVVEIARSSFYAWLAAADTRAAKTAADEELAGAYPRRAQRGQHLRCAADHRRAQRRCPRCRSGSTTSGWPG